LLQSLQRGKNAPRRIVQGKVQKLAAELAAELAELSKQQSEALLASAYIRMSPQQSEEYDKRRLRIGELSDLVSKYKPK
jgi:hypothetical protein